MLAPSAASKLKLVEAPAGSGLPWLKSTVKSIASAGFELAMREKFVTELVKAKMEGRKIAPPQVPQPTRPVDLMEALRQSAEGDNKAPDKPKRASRKTTRSKTTKRRKAA